MTRIAYYVASTHWDREWYESFQGFRARIVSLIDEVLATFERDPAFSTFVMDGQLIPILDYLEVRPDQVGTIRRLVREGRLRLGPWFVLPDEWLVSGESLVRNLQYGMAWSTEFGAPSSRAGIVCDQFGHIGQLPQIFAQLGLLGALIWRGTQERDHAGSFLWRAPDGTALPTYRFGHHGYCNYAVHVREAWSLDTPFDLETAIERLISYTQTEAKRSPVGPILLFDGGDHLEIEPQTSTLLAQASHDLAAQGIQIVHADLDQYLEGLAAAQDQLSLVLTGELRETGRDPTAIDQQWLIPGVLSSRIHLKQRNAACEDELCVWAEPFSAFASSVGQPYPVDFLRVAWRHLLENHPHDSICGCSIDQVHQDMIYRFDQSFDIASRLTRQALQQIACAAAPRTRPDGALVLTVFNPSTVAIDEPVDLEIPFPTDWPGRFQEFFGFEEKFAFTLSTDEGTPVPYQLTAQRLNQRSFRRPRYKFPDLDMRHVISITAQLQLPACGYTTLIVAPVQGPTRYLGSLCRSHRSLENEYLIVQVNTNGTLKLTDKRTGSSFDQLLTFEQRADIGDGWFHGLAVADQIYTSVAASADVALVADGLNKATFRIRVVLNVPECFEFDRMNRSQRLVPLQIVSDVTLRRGVDRIEVQTTVENTVRDHRLRVLFPTGLQGESYLADSAFDVVERPIAVAADNQTRRELDLETRPQQTWTAFGDGECGLAIVSRGLPETAVQDTSDRTIALTLLRAFGRAVLANENVGGQIQGTHSFRYAIVPFVGNAPRAALSRLGQRIISAVRTVDLLPHELNALTQPVTLPASSSFVSVTGSVVVTSLQQQDDRLLMRFFNPEETTTQACITLRHRPAAAQAVMLDSRVDPLVECSLNGDQIVVEVPAKRIVTLLI
jgi:alpha-mannosidase